MVPPNLLHDSFILGIVQSLWGQLGMSSMVDILSFVSMSKDRTAPDRNIDIAVSVPV